MMKFTNTNMSEKGLAPFTAVMAALGTGVVAAQTAAIKGVMHSRPLTIAVLLPTSAVSAIVLGSVTVNLCRALLTGDVSAIRETPAHLHIFMCALAIFALITTALYIKAYKFGADGFIAASSLILRIGIIGGFIMVLVSIWFEKTSFYTASVVVISVPLAVAEVLATMIATHPVAAGQPVSEIEKYLWNGAPRFVATVCGAAGFAVVTLRVLIWFFYLRH